MMDTESEQAHTEKRGHEMQSEKKKNEQISSEIVVLHTKKKISETRINNNNR